MIKKWIYLDNHATTPLHPGALKKMLPFFGATLDEKNEHAPDAARTPAARTSPSENQKLEAQVAAPPSIPLFGNPASASHPFGWQTAEAVHSARKNLLNLLNVPKSHLVFTSGASESIQLALFGFVRSKLSSELNHKTSSEQMKPLKFLTTPIEHKVVLAAFELLKNQGHIVEYVDVDQDGMIIQADLENKLKTCDFCSIIHGNNEIGTLQDLKKISELCQKYEVILHVDAAQSFVKIKIDLNETPTHFLSFSAHKFYGPKGIGGLVISPEGLAHIAPLYETGASAQTTTNLRIGTANVPGIVGMAEAAMLTAVTMQEDCKRFEAFREQILSRLNQKKIEFKLNGHPSERLPQNLNLSFPGLTASLLSRKLSGIAYSTGSACSSDSPHQSHVLKAIGLPDELIRTAIRIGFGHFTTDDEIKWLIEKLETLT